MPEPASSPTEQEYAELMQRALAELRSLRAELKAREDRAHEPIAVVAVGCRFPGPANDVDRLWQALLDGVDAVVEVPAERWDVDRHFPPGADGARAAAGRFGSFLDDVDQFDAEFFGISAREAESMDPQQRLLLEVTWEALERAAVNPRSLRGTRTGTFVGMMTLDYAQLASVPERIDIYTGTGNAASVAAGRLAYTLGLHGPAMCIDTACSSSLVAVHLACQSLRSRECDAAFAAGAHLQLTPTATLVESRGRMLSPNGRCKPFDARADGIVRGEGVATVLLKRLGDALRDGDPVLAVVRGSAVNHDGPSAGLTVPNEAAQERVIREALADARIEPTAVGYVEAHGTGTVLGDPIEVSALARVLRPAGHGVSPLPIGSAKSNFGHLEGAAGILGFIKGVLAVERAEIPPSLHFVEPNPHIDWSAVDVRVADTRARWGSADAPRVAGVSSFGLSGTNAHVIVAQAPERAWPQSTPRPPELVVASAETGPGAATLARQFAERVRDADAETLTSIAATSAVGRRADAYRIAAIGSDGAELADALLRAPVPRSVRSEPRIAFMFTGQGAQYAGMGRELCALEPVFRDAIERCDSILASTLGHDLMSLLGARGDRSGRLDQTAFTQPVLFSVEYALASLWQSWGVEPEWLIGHSVGEYVAACVAGVWSLEDALEIVCERGRLMQAEPAGGAMVAVAASEASVRELLETMDEPLAIAAVNAPDAVVASGARRGIDALAAKLSARSIRWTPLEVSHAFHSPLMTPVLGPFERFMRERSFGRQDRPIVSNVTGAMARDELSSPDYWVQHVAKPVQFARGLEAVHAAGCDLFVEIGPKPVLCGFGRRCIDDTSVAWIPSLGGSASEWSGIAAALGELYTRGVSINFDALYRHREVRRVSLPTYPWRRRRYWVDEQTSGAPSPVGEAIESGIGAEVHTALASHGERIFETRFGAGHTAVAEHRVNGVATMPAAGLLDMALAAARRVLDAPPTVLESFELAHPLAFDTDSGEDGDRIVQVVITPGQDDILSIRIVSRDAVASPPARWTEHARARAHARPVTAGEVPPHAVIQSGLSHSDTDFYERAAASGLDYGPSYRVLSNLESTLNSAYGVFVNNGLAEIPYLSSANWPMQLDGCLQLIGAAAAGGEGDPGLYLPVSLERLVIGQPAGAPERGYARITSSADTLVADFWMLDASGATIAHGQGVRLRRVVDPALAANRNLLFRSQWMAAPLEASTPSCGRDWLVLAADGVPGADLAAEIRSSGASCTVEAWSMQGSAAAIHDRIASEPAPSGRLGVVAMLPAPDEPDPASVEAMTGACLHLFNACAEVATATPVAIWLITRGAADSDPQATAPSPAAAAVWGLARVATIEYPELEVVRIDIASTDDTPSVAQELGAGGAEEEVTFRRGERRISRITPWREAQDDSPTVEAFDGAWLVAGGTGALGLEVAQWLVDSGASHIVLTARRAPDGVVAEKISAIGGHGPMVRFEPADISEPREVERLLADIDARGLSLRGVVHAAGTLDDGLLRDQTTERFARVFASKVRGAWNLHRATADRALDRFITFSSAAAELGAAGQGGYAAANGFLDGLAHYRHALGLPALSVNWGPWASAGMAVGDDRSAAAWEAAGVRPLAPARGLSALAMLLGQNAPQCLAIDIDWPVAVSRWPGGRRPARLSLVAPAPGPHVDSTALLSDLGSSDREARATRLTDYIRDAAATVLRMPPRDLDPGRPLNRLGLASLAAMELRDRLQTSLGLEVPIATILDGASVSDVVEWVSSRLDEDAAGSAKRASVIGPDEAARLLDDMETLDDSAVDALLDSMLSERRELT